MVTFGDMIKHFEIRVYGRVQGVGFRHAARNQARTLNLKGWVENLRDGLVEVDPDNAETYRENAEVYIAELEALDENITADLSSHFGERFLVYHPSFGYFAHDYGLVQMAIEEEGKEPGSAGLAAVIDQAKEHDIRVVFVSPQFSQESARAIAEEIGGKVLTLNSLAGDYIDNIGDISQKLISALGEVSR